MTAALTHSDAADTRVFRDATTQARLVVVLVAPTNSLPQCAAAIENTVLAGAITITCEIGTDHSRLAEAIGTVMDTVDDAFGAYPGLPVVLVGHADAAAVASFAAEAYGDDLAGLVVTHNHAVPGPARRAA